jgi:hypothetical protein
MSQPRSFEFWLVPARGAAFLGQSRFGDLRTALDARLPLLTTLSVSAKVDEATLMRGSGYVAGSVAPLVEMVTVELSAKVPRDEIRAQLQAAIAEDLARPDLTVVDGPGAPRPRAPQRRVVSRRGRRESEWYARLLLLSNRLTRYAYAGQRAVEPEYRRLLLAEARMADVLFAANGVETCYLRIRPVTDAFARTPFWRRMGTPGALMMDPQARTPRVRRLVNSVRDAHADFHAMLWWGRSLMDRVEGSWGEERVKGKWVEQPIGLVEWLPRRDATRVRKALNRLRKGAFAEVRDLADYSLHAFAVPEPQGQMRIEADGTYTLPLPDRLGRKPVVGEDFTFEERRHIGAEAEALWLGVQRFMDEVLDVLEAGQLRREEKLPAEARKLMRLLRDRLVPPDTRRQSRRGPGATSGRAGARSPRARAAGRRSGS